MYNLSLEIRGVDIQNIATLPIFEHTAEVTLPYDLMEVHTISV